MTPAAPATPASGDAPAGKGIDAAVWSARVATGVRVSYQWVTLPRVRLWLVGLALLFVGGIVTTNSVWTLPLVIAGALMVITAWVGHRLDGRVALQWGAAGAQIDLRATVRAAAHAAGQAATPPAAAAERAPVAAEAVIEGEAHTVEIDVAELKALIAAAEAAQDTAAAGAAEDTAPIRTAQPARPAAEPRGAGDIRVTRIPR